MLLSLAHLGLQDSCSSRVRRRFLFQSRATTSSKRKTGQRVGSAEGAGHSCRGSDRAKRSGNAATPRGSPEVGIGSRISSKPIIKVYLMDGRDSVIVRRLNFAVRSRYRGFYREKQSRHE